MTPTYEVVASGCPSLKLLVFYMSISNIALLIMLSLRSSYCASLSCNDRILPTVGLRKLNQSRPNVFSDWTRIAIPIGSVEIGF